MELGKRVKTNVKDRVQAIDILVQGFEKDLSAFTDHLRVLEPLQAVVSLTETKGKGSLEFLNRQIEISRRWISTR